MNFRTIAAFVAALSVAPAGSPCASGASAPIVSLELPPAAPSRPSWKAPDADLAALVVDAAWEAGVPAWIAARLVAAESSWRPDAVGVNRDGSRDLGLAQLNERWLDDFAFRFNDGAPVDPFDPETAARVATRYLARLYGATGSWRLAVAAYNCGLTRVREDRIPASTLKYVERIFQGIDL